MDFAFSDEEDATGDLAAQILGDLASHERLREIERSAEPRFDQGCWDALAKAGLLGISVPESAGGAGLGAVALGRLLQAVGATGAAVPAWETLALGADPIGRYGSDEVASEWLPGVVEGRTLLSAAWHGTDRDRSTLTVSASGSDDALVVTGAVRCVPAGAIAAGVVVPVSSDGGPALVVVDTAASGVTVTPLVSTAGSPDAAVSFSGAPAMLLARGTDVVQAAFDRAVATQCAVTLGNAEKMLALIASYTKERKQFDVPIATFQAVGHRAADCYIDCEAMRLTTWQALSRLDEGLPASAEISVAKHWAASAGHRISIAAAHLHGGVGVDRDYPLARHYTRAKELELQLGGSTEHLLRLGREIAAAA